MRVPTQPQSPFRYPLNRVFASEGTVRVVRELVRHGREVSIAALVAATKLHRETVRLVLARDLVPVGFAEPVGATASGLYRVRPDHPLHDAVARLFAEEEARVGRVFGALAAAARAAAPDVLAVWVYGSTARGEDASGSDLDVALVLPDADPDPGTERYRELLDAELRHEQVSVSVVGLSAADVARLSSADDPWWSSMARDAVPVLGSPPAALAARLAPTPGARGATVA